MGKPRASVIILNWNGKRFLDDLFTCLEKQTYPDDQFEVIMIDNNSIDDSVPFVYTNYPWVRIIENDRNDGFARGNNIGMQHAKGDYIVLLNNDTKPEPAWLAELIQVADEKNKAGAVVSKLMFANRPGVINNAGSELKDHSDWPFGERGMNEQDTGQYEKVEEITAFCGASVLLNRKMLEEIGLFDDAFFMYFEDGDLSWRGQRAGWRFYYTPKSVVHHIHTGSSVEYSPLFNYYVARNRLLVLFKNSSYKMALMGYFKVMKVRLLDAFTRLVKATVKRSNRREALTNMQVGLKVFVSTLYQIPRMILKRYGVIMEISL